MTEAYLRMRDVVARTTLSESTIRKLLAGKRFPQPVRLGQGRVAWRASEVDAAMVALIEEQSERGPR